MIPFFQRIGRFRILITIFEQRFSCNDVEHSAKLQGFLIENLIPNGSKTKNKFHSPIVNYIAKDKCSTGT